MFVAVAIVSGAVCRNAPGLFNSIGPSDTITVSCKTTERGIRWTARSETFAIEDLLDALVRNGRMVTDNTFHIQRFILQQIFC